jgi:hypothetical protein
MNAGGDEGVNESAVEAGLVALVAWFPAGGRIKPLSGVAVDETAFPLGEVEPTCKAGIAGKTMKAMNINTSNP